MHCMLPLCAPYRRSRVGTGRETGGAQIPGHPLTRIGRISRAWVYNQRFPPTNDTKRSGTHCRKEQGERRVKQKGGPVTRNRVPRRKTAEGRESTVPRTLGIIGGLNGGLIAYPEPTGSDVDDADGGTLLPAALTAQTTAEGGDGDSLGDG